MSAQAPDMEIPLTPQQQTEEVLRRLQAGELTGRVKVIILIGPCGSGKANLMKLFTGRDIVIGHRLQDGTVRPTCLLASHNGQAYIFIDTPGFGHPDFTKYEIKEKILGLLGYFTRTLGGVHGFLFIQSARETRPTPGIRDSVSFLKELGVD
ncbi:hypothetical protein EDB80DRAFT_900505 [Ilyonectria destructans]|nr:hypothetical protein EDB80DRAFT_900505 [Ilyonectria destructans]